MNTRPCFALTALSLALITGCTTFGVEAEDHILTTNSTAQGIERISVVNMPTDQGLTIRGGNDMFEGEMRVTGWFAPDQDHDIFDYISMFFDHQDTTVRPATLYHSHEAEHITVRTVTLDIPALIDVDVNSPGGRVQVTDIDGDVDVFANGLAAIARVTGPVSARASAIYVEDTGPVSLDAVGDITGDINRGGVAESELGNIDIQVPGTDFSELMLGVWKTDIDVKLPAGEGFTLDIYAGLSVQYGSGGDEEDDYEDEELGHVEINVGDLYVDTTGVVDGIYDVNGGGPLIVIRDAHELTIRD